MAASGTSGIDTSGFAHDEAAYLDMLPAPVTPAPPGP
jgi:hypothetical protein